MNKFYGKAEIQAPASIVWKKLTDVDHWHEWSPTITSIRQVNGGPFAVGKKLRIQQPKLPTSVWIIESVEQERSFFMRKKNCLLSVIAGHELEEVNGITLLTLSIEFKGASASWVGRKYEAMMLEYLSIEARSLKSASEKVGQRHFSAML